MHCFLDVTRLSEVEIAGGRCGGGGGFKSIFHHERLLTSIIPCKHMLSRGALSRQQMNQLTFETWKSLRNNFLYFNGSWQSTGKHSLTHSFIHLIIRCLSSYISGPGTGLTGGDRAACKTSIISELTVECRAKALNKKYSVRNIVG